MDSWIREARVGRVHNIQQALAQGVDVNRPEANGDLGLHEAARHKHTAVVSLLLSAKALPNQYDLCGWTALHYAVSRSASLPLVRLLLEAGASPLQIAKDGAGETVFHMLASSSFFDIDGPGVDGDKPRVDMARLLCEHGGALALCELNSSGQTVIQLCISDALSELLQYLDIVLKQLAQHLVDLVDEAHTLRVRSLAEVVAAYLVPAAPTAKELADVRRRSKRRAKLARNSEFPD